MRFRSWSRSLLSGALLVVSAGFIFAGCGGSSGRVVSKDYDDPNPLPAEPMVVDVSGQYGGRFVYVTIGDPKTFNPTIANETSSTDIINGPVFESIIQFNNYDQVMEPGLCKTWEVSDDGLTWTFHFRKGVRWSDGHPFSVDDVIFTSQVVYDTDIQASVRALLIIEGKPFTWTAVDSLTLEVTVPAPYGPVPEVVSSMYILPRHQLEEPYKEGRFEQMWGINADLEEIACLGPFRLIDYRNGERVLLRRNPHYWKVDRDGRRLPYLDELIFVPVKDYNATMLKFTSGESDLLDPVRPGDVALLEDESQQKDFTVVDLGTDVATNFIWFNMNPGSDDNGKPFVEPYKLKWFKSQKFRRAFSHAIDRGAMVKTVLYDRGNELYAPMTPANKRWFYEDMPRWKYDPDRANTLLNEIGFIDRDGDGIREDPDGNKIDIVLNTNSENTVRKGLATVAQQNLMDVGIEINFQPLEFNTIINHLRNDYKYEAILLGLTGGVPPDPALSRNVWLSSGVTHFWHPEQDKPHTEWEAEIDRLMDEVVKATRYEDRKIAFDKVQHIIGEVQPFVYLARENLVVAVSNDFQGIRPSVLRPHVMWNIEEIYYQPGGELASR